MQSRNEERINMARSMISKLSGAMPPDIKTGRANTTHILNILLPTMLPIRRSLSFLRAAATVVTSSGREVPIATIVRETIRSEMPIPTAMAEAELTTSSLPATMPAKPRNTKKIDLPSLYCGFSTFFMSFLFLRASENR